MIRTRVEVHLPAAAELQCDGLAVARARMFQSVYKLRSVTCPKEFAIIIQMHLLDTEHHHLMYPEISWTVQHVLKLTQVKHKDRSWAIRPIKQIQLYLISLQQHQKDWTETENSCKPQREGMSAMVPQVCTKLGEKTLNNLEPSLSNKKPE